MANYFVNFSLCVSVVLLGLGGFLLYDSINHPSPIEAPEVLGAAALFAVGLILLCTQGKRAVKRVAAERHHRHHYES